MEYSLPCSCHIKVVMPTSQCMCRGSRAALQECAATWYTTPDPHLQALLRCQLYAGAGSSSTSASSYLDLQCSSGYEGRLCSICVVMALQVVCLVDNDLLAHSIACSVTHSPTRSLTHPLARSLPPSLTHRFLVRRPACS